MNNNNNKIWKEKNEMSGPPDCARGFTCSFNHSSDSQTAIANRERTLGEHQIQRKWGEKKGGKRRTGPIAIGLHSPLHRSGKIDFQHTAFEFVHIHVVDCVLSISG